MVERLFVIRGKSPHAKNSAAWLYWYGGEAWDTDFNGAKRLLQEELEQALYRDLAKTLMSQIEAIVAEETIY